MARTAEQAAWARSHLDDGPPPRNARFDLAQLAAATEGFSGAEIEESVGSGLYAAFAEDRPMTTGDVLAAVRGTRPLSQMAGEKLAALRNWAEQRTVAAD